MAQKWTVLQRKCLQYLSEDLCSIRELIKLFGSDALRYYCQRGHLKEGLIKRIQGYVPTGMPQAEVSHEDKDGGGDEHEGEDEMERGDEDEEYEESEPSSVDE